MWGGETRFENNVCPEIEGPRPRDLDYTIHWTAKPISSASVAQACRVAMLLSSNIVMGPHALAMRNSIGSLTLADLITITIQKSTRTELAAAESFGYFLTVQSSLCCYSDLLPFLLRLTEAWERASSSGSRKA